MADGGASNWSVHRPHFSQYTPILDFTHALMCVYAAAMASRAAEQGWTNYRQWAQWLWSGQFKPLLQALAARGQALRPPGDDEAATSPRRLVADACRYVTNQRSRMDYAEYRRLGLPITSSHIESTIKPTNRRMKGSEKSLGSGRRTAPAIGSRLSQPNRRNKPLLETTPQPTRHHPRPANHRLKPQTAGCTQSAIVGYFRGIGVSPVQLPA